EPAVESVVVLIADDEIVRPGSGVRAGVRVVPDDQIPRSIHRRVREAGTRDDLKIDAAQLQRRAIEGPELELAPDTLAVRSHPQRTLQCLRDAEGGRDGVGGGGHPRQGECCEGESTECLLHATILLGAAAWCVCVRATWLSRVCWRHALRYRLGVDRRRVGAA